MPIVKWPAQRSSCSHGRSVAQLVPRCLTSSSATASRSSDLARGSLIHACPANFSADFRALAESNGTASRESVLASVSGEPGRTAHGSDARRSPSPSTPPQQQQTDFALGPLVVLRLSSKPYQSGTVRAQLELQGTFEQRRRGRPLCLVEARSINVITKLRGIARYRTRDVFHVET